MTDACKQVFEKIKTKKDYRYVVFYIKDEKFIDVESTGNFWAFEFVYEMDLFKNDVMFLL